MTFKLLFLVVILVVYGASSTPMEESIHSIIESSNTVSNNIYKLLGQDNENVLFCPVSSNLLLSLVTLGSQGKTAQELRTALHLGNNNEVIKKGYQNLLKELSNDLLKLATQLFPKTGVVFNPQFLTVAQKYFDSNVQALDYQNAQSAALTINTFVEEKTNNKIHDLISPASITADTKLILVNAAHFKDNWLHPFHDVFDADFYSTKDNKVTIKMMENTKTYKFMKSTLLNAKVLQLHFMDSKYSMVFILPSEVDGLRQLENTLESVNFANLISNLTDNRVQVKIPKFKIEATIQLKPLLQKLGIKTLFTDDAELNGIIGDNQALAVTEAIQKTFMDVNEDGVEAAAGSSIIISAASLEVSYEPPEEFIADHPFVFAIMRDNLIIFQGKLTKVENK